jgi:hypothetical protein
MDILKPELLAYMAGIVDGEGSIFITHNKNSDMPRIGIGMTDRAVPQLFADTFGGSFRCKPPAGLGKKDIWYWQITGRRAVQILTYLYPYLIIKKVKAQECFNLHLPTYSDSAKERTRSAIRNLKGQF